MTREQTLAALSAEKQNDPSLALTVNAVAVELEASVVENEIDTAVAHVGDELPDPVQVVSKNVLLGGSEMLTTGRLQVLDVLFGHVDQQ